MSDDTISAPRQSSTAAGVVAFGPDPELLLPLVRSALEEAERVYVFVNALIDEALCEELLELCSR